jgi:hypothetical protein
MTLTIFVEELQMMINTKYIFGKKIFKDYSFGCHGSQSSAWNGIL